jgi:hypothetical protein
MIDRVAVKGSKMPLHLYTFDVLNYPPQIGIPPANPRVFARDAAFAIDDSVLLLQEGMHPQFKWQFQRGLDAYFAGDWAQAKRDFEAVLELRPEDGPSRTLVEYMRELNFTRPIDWDGFRVLTEK